ncbi:MAG: tetratricopeptide repeat protein, partial [bacterium]
KDQRVDVEAFYDQDLTEAGLAWLLTQPTFDVYELWLKQKYVRALSAYGDQALAHGDMPVAERLYHFALQLDPSRVDLYRGLGLTLLETEQWEEAEKVFLDLTTREPNDPLYAFGHAVALFQLGKADEARIEAARAKTLDPTNKFLEREAAFFERWQPGVDLEQFMQEETAPPVKRPEEESD